ncbi:MAG: MgtC/SapB family protein, partial [Flavobacteriales bacterium]
MEELLKGIGPKETIGFLIAVGIGVLMGLEREYSKKGGEETTNTEIFAGIRTFPLIAILGYLLMFLGRELSIWIFTVGTLGILCFAIVSYVSSYKRRGTG